MSDLSRQMHTLAAWQKRLLPPKLPAPSGWQLAAHYAPGPSPGGDFYDVLEIPDQRLLLVLADASDQGAPATALVVLLRAILHSCPLSSGLPRSPFCPFQEPVLQPPHVLLGHLNHVITENSLEEQYLTMFCGQLDVIDGNFHYSNAGHPAPRWWHARSRTVEGIRDSAGLPLGYDPRAAYHHKRIVLEPADVLVLYSDGVTAATNQRGCMFGAQRLDEVLAQTAHHGAAAVAAAIQEALRDFLEGNVPNDDVTFLAVSRGN